MAQDILVEIQHHLFKRQPQDISKMKYTKNKRIQGFFPIHQYRFNTEKHPIITSTAKRSAKIVVPMSSHEKQMLEGLTNILQCDQNEAIRIALYEFSQEDGVSDVVSEKASSLTDNRYHSGRRNKVTVKLPGDEKTGEIFGLTEKAVVRAAIIWLSYGIRSDQIKRLTKSPAIGIEKLAREWSKNRPEDAEAKPSIKRLREVQKENYEIAKEEALAEIEYRHAKTEAFFLENPVYANLIGQDLIDYQDVANMAMMDEDADQMDFILDTLDGLAEPSEDEEQMSEEELEELCEMTFQASKTTPREPIKFMFSDKMNGEKPASRYTEEDWEEARLRARQRYQKQMEKWDKQAKENGETEDHD